MMMYNVTPIIGAVLTLISALITCFLVPWIRSKTTNEQLQNINYWVNVAVQAAEMLYTGSGKGEEKLYYVIEFLKSKGFVLDDTELRAMVEAAVLELKQYFA